MINLRTLEVNVNTSHNISMKTKKQLLRKTNLSIFWHLSNRQVYFNLRMSWRIRKKSEHVMLNTDLAVKFVPETLKSS